MDLLEILQIPNQGLFCPDLITIKLKKNQEDQTTLFGLSGPRLSVWPDAAKDCKPPQEKVPRSSHFV